MANLEGTKRVLSISNSQAWRCRTLPQQPACIRRQNNKGPEFN